MGKVLVVAGLGIAGVGLVVMLGVPLGRLPGDLYLRRGGFSFSIPVTSSILLSLVLTAALAFLRR